MKFSQADSRNKMWFSDVSGNNSVPIIRVCWWFGRISFGSTKPPAHPEDGDGVSSQNVRKPSYIDVAVGLRKFH